MRSFFVGVVAVFFLFALSGCSSALEEKNASSQWGGATGSVKVALASGNDGRKLDVSTIKNVRYTVESSDMVKLSGTASVNGGRGEFSIESIPVGKNRIISIRSDVKGFEISEVVDIKAGENTISTINWITSARANVYKKLLGNRKEIADFTAEQNDWISKAVPARTAAYLVDVDSIVSDFAALRTGNAYVLDYGKVSFLATSANGFVVCINDPCSESKTVSSDNTYTIGGVAPGDWGYTVTDDSGKVTEKSVVIRPGETTPIDPIGNPLNGRLFVFVKAPSAPKIWAWETTGSQVELSVGLGEEWNTQPPMTEATKVYMANPAGWYMKDFTSAKPSGGEITFKLNQADPEIASGKTSTFWYDGEKFYDADPTENLIEENDVTLSSVTVGEAKATLNGKDYSLNKNGLEDTFSGTIVAIPTDSNATVTCSMNSVSLSSGESSVITITVKNGDKSATYTLTVKYTKRNQSEGGEGDAFETEYYWTNKNSAVGVEKTISSFSDWTEDMIIAQGAANDDPRAFRGYHEKATDFYALFAAYDKSNLYLMVEMPSIDGRDITSKDWQYALDENLGMGVAIRTGLGAPGDGEMDTGITAWNKEKYYSITECIDTLLMFHPAEYGTPGFFVTNDDGKFSYDAPYLQGFKENGIETSREVGLVSRHLYGRSDNYGLSKEEYLAKTDYVDMLSDSEKTDVSGYKYQITIPLSALGIDYSYLTSKGISVMTFSTFGTSMMDALPWCPDLIDNAAKEYSADPSTSHEKEDVDTYNVKLARVGHM